MFKAFIHTRKCAHFYNIFCRYYLSRQLRPTPIPPAILVSSSHLHNDVFNFFYVTSAPSYFPFLFYRILVLSSCFLLTSPLSALVILVLLLLILRILTLILLQLKGQYHQNVMRHNTHKVLVPILEQPILERPFLTRPFLERPILEPTNPRHDQS